MRTIQTILILFAVLLITACSGGSENPVEPLNTATAPQSVENNHRQVLGIWDILISEDFRIEVIPIRNADMHFNLTKILEVTNCLKVDNVQLYQDYFSVDIIVMHPFPGHLEFTGFDPRGIFIGQGDYTFPVSGKTISWDGTFPLLLNADGYTSLFNPEFSNEWPCLSFYKGNLSNWNEQTELANLNSFVAYCRDEPRRVFESTASATRTVQLPFSLPLQFVFAFDVSWYPVNGEITNPVEDFPPEANCAEAYKIDIQVGAGLKAKTGASVPIEVEVFDWQGVGTIKFVSIESPNLFTGEVTLNSKNPGSNTFLGTLINELGAETDEYPLLVKVTDFATDPNLGVVEAYQVYPVSVGEKRGWVRTWGNEKTDLSYGVAVDIFGNVYSTGRFESTVDFDSGPGVDSHTSNGKVDVFLSKFDSEGSHLWTQTFGGDHNDFGHDVCVDYFGNVYVTGRFESTVDFDPSDGTDNHTSNGICDVFLIKFSSDGYFIWARTWGSNDQDIPHGLIESTTSIFVTGEFRGIADFDPSDDIDNHTSNGGIDAFLSKIDLDGNFQWAHTWGSYDPSGGMADNDCGNDVTIDYSGNAYVTGYFQNTVDFDPSDGIDNHTSNGAYDAFLTKFSSDGHFVWARTWGGEGGDGQARAVYSDNYENIYISGCFTGTVDFDPSDGIDNHTSNGAYDAFLTKFSSDGHFVWARTWGGSFSDVTNGMVLENSSIFVTGSFQKTVDFDPGPNIDEHTSNGGQADVFLSKFDLEGIFLWARTFGGTEEMYMDEGKRVDADVLGNVYILGNFYNTVDFDPGLGEYWQSSNGYADVFLSKFPSDGNW